LNMDMAEKRIGMAGGNNASERRCLIAAMGRIPDV
jgi:hypothetical protein